MPISWIFILFKIPFFVLAGAPRAKRRHSSNVVDSSKFRKPDYGLVMLLPHIHLSRLCRATSEVNIVCRLANGSEEQAAISPYDIAARYRVSYNSTHDRLGTRTFQLKTRTFQLETQTFQLETRTFQLKTQTFQLELELFSSKLQLFNSKLQLFNSKLQLFNSKLQLFNSKLQLFNSKLQLFNSKLELFNSKL